MYSTNGCLDLSAFFLTVSPYIWHAKRNRTSQASCLLIFSLALNRNPPRLTATPMLSNPLSASIVEQGFPSENIQQTCMLQQTLCLSEFCGIVFSLSSSSAHTRRGLLHTRVGVSAREEWGSSPLNIMSDVCMPMKTTFQLFAYFFPQHQDSVQ